ncbi:MAG: hypothetical protein YK1309IOTA_480006 [Marine Group I thaumarchaeote]|nr:MAG: hypothetical protein YK1309IOTA_480006 [Marine Group I thaumarchaeote]
MVINKSILVAIIVAVPIVILAFSNSISLDISQQSEDAQYTTDPKTAKDCRFTYGKGTPEMFECLERIEQDMPRMFTTEAVLDIAQEFIKSSPTFAFDGMEETLSLELVAIRESFPEQFVIEADFDSLHGGYGDRTDEMVIQVITPHTMNLVVINGEITSAILDGKWDELNQLQLPWTPTKGPDETVSHGGPAVDYVSLIDNLRANDATVNPEGEIEQPFFSVTGFSIQVNGASVQVFEYDTAEDAEADASLVSPDGSSIGSSTGTTMPFWVDDPHFYYKEKIIVLYVGDDPAIEKLLKSVLGSQFAGR